MFNTLKKRTTAYLTVFLLPGLLSLSLYGQSDFLEYVSPEAPLPASVVNNIQTYLIQIDDGLYSPDYSLLRFKEQSLETEPVLNFQLGGNTYYVDKQLIEQPGDASDQNLSVKGVIVDHPGSYFQFFRWKGHSTLRIDLGSETVYQFKALGEGYYLLLSPLENGDEGCDHLREYQGDSQSSDPRMNCVGTRYLRVLYVATKTVGDMAGYGSIEAAIRADMNSSNQLLTNAPNYLGYFQMEFAGLEITTNSGWKEYDEPASCTFGSTYVNFMTAGLANGTGTMGFLKKMRKDYAADYVCLITSQILASNGNCTLLGKAGGIGVGEADAVMVMKWDAINNGLYTLLHEVGHNLGGRHDTDNAVSDFKGYADCTAGLKTVMAQLASCGNRQPVLSSPSSFFPGTSTLAGTANNNVKQVFLDNNCDHSMFREDNISYNNYVFDDPYMQRTIRTKGEVSMFFTTFQNNARVEVKAEQGFNLWFYHVKGGASVTFTHLAPGGATRQGQPMEDIQSEPTVSVADETSELQAYPNPFEEELMISYFLKEPQYVSLEIYDLKGAKVAVLQAGNQKPGKHAQQWRPIDQHIGAGLYLVRLQTAEGMQTKKVRFL